MNSLAVSGIIFVCLLGGVLVGVLLRRLLPVHHLSPESKDVVKVGTGLIATMTALVLGLLVASAKSSFDSQGNELTHVAANVLMLDRMLAHYGPETKEIRGMIRDAVAATLKKIWPDDGSEAGQVQPTAGTEVIYDRIIELDAKTDSQRTLKAEAIKLAFQIAQTRWLLFSQRESSIPTPFLVVVTFWLAILFVSFSVFAPSNLTVYITLFVCALSVAAALFFVIELDRPFTGLIQISSEPLRNALEQLGR